MRLPNAIVLSPLLLILACGVPETETTAPAAAPRPESASSSLADHALGLNNTISLDESIRQSWIGAKVEVKEIETTERWEFDIDLGETRSLGETGLTLEAKVFIPDFTMDEGGITSTSSEPANPALQVVITDQSGETYEGWLFAAMPEIHAYQHAKYSVILLEGINTTE